MDEADGPVLILGAGPTGLGAAHRLERWGHRRYLVLEREDAPGGLAASVRDPAGYTWDLGAHVLYSHYEYFDAVLDGVMRDDWLEHTRSTWIRFGDRFVPYPFQYNLGALPAAARRRCLETLPAARPAGPPPPDFETWILRQFGAGIAAEFMLPYNRKVWAHEPREMAATWTAERVPPLDVARVKRGAVPGARDGDWGPNHRFRYPARGGAGEPWRRLAAALPPGRLRLGCPVTAVDLAARTVTLAGGEVLAYAALISTLPLDRLAALCRDEALAAAVAPLRSSAVTIHGAAVRGRPPSAVRGRAWFYVPGPEAPFYRASVASHFSPANVPDPDAGWSILLETSRGPARPAPPGDPEEATRRGLVAAGLVGRAADITRVWSRVLPRGYPVPTRDRDAALARCRARLEPLGVFSRGRFGSWKYEVSNQDHSFMQGVEVVDRILGGRAEPTLDSPGAVNRPGKRPPPPEPA